MTGTPPISHTGHSNRFPCLLNFFRDSKSLVGSDAYRAVDGLGPKFEIEAVKSHTQSAEEKQRREVLCHQWKNGGWQRNLKGIGVAGSKVMNDTGKKHVKEAAANVLVSVRSGAAAQLYLRNRLAAKGALLQMRRHVLAAIYAAQLIRDRSCHCTHTASHHLSLG